MKKLIIFLSVIIAAGSGCAKELTPVQKIARQISREYKALGNADSAAYYLKLSKQ